MNSQCILKVLSGLLYTFDWIRETVLASNICLKCLFCVADDFLPLGWVCVERAGSIVSIPWWWLWEVDGRGVANVRWVWSMELSLPSSCIGEEVSVTKSEGVHASTYGETLVIIWKNCRIIGRVLCYHWYST